MKIKGFKFKSYPKKKKKLTTWLDDKENPRMNPHTKTKLIEIKGEKKSHRYNRILLLFLFSPGLYMSVGTYRIGEQGWQCEEYCHFAKRAASSYSEILSARKFKILILP